MAGNRTELILSTISNVISDVDEGMSQSCSRIEEALLLRIDSKKNRQERGKSYSVNLEHLRKRSTPLLEDVDRELTYKKRYATLVVLNITAHYAYACAALEKMLHSIGQVVVDNFNTDQKDYVITFRPHTLGAIRPPDPSDVITEVRKRLGSMNVCLDSATVSTALEAIANEIEDFRRENHINNAFNKVSTEQDSAEQASRIVQITGKIDNLADYYSDFVYARAAEHGVDWRPSGEWNCPFENIWGDNKITMKTLSDIFTGVVIPNIELANFLLYMCYHIRAVIKSIKIILFSRERSEYFENTIFSDWRVWLNLYKKLEWFMLTARYVIFLHSKKESFLEEEDDHQKCFLGFLAAVVECIPPNLLVKDWVQKVLFSWPSDETQAEHISIELLVSLGLRTSPGAKHCIFGSLNRKEYAITNRISTNSAIFCARVLLGRALDEEEAGTKMMVAAAEGKTHDRGRRKTGDNCESLGVLPVEKIDCSRCRCSTIVTDSPFVANPTYLFKKIWGMEILAKEVKEENAAKITKIVLDKVGPLLFDVGGGEWKCLRLLSCCQAPSLISRAWTSALKEYNGPDPCSRVQTMAEKICHRTKELDAMKSKAASGITSFLFGAKDIQDSNNATASAAENALWATSVWKKLTTAILTQLQYFPE